VERCFTSKIYPSSFTHLEWIHSPSKSNSNAPIIWKPLVQAFPLVGRWLALKVNDGRSIQLGVDSWIGGGNLCRFFMELQTFLRGLYKFSLVDVRSVEGVGIWGGGWLSSANHGLVNLEAIEWDGFAQAFSSSYINLREEESSLVWAKKPARRFYAPKLGYEAMFSMDIDQYSKWW